MSVCWGPFTFPRGERCSSFQACLPRRTCNPNKPFCFLSSQLEAAYRKGVGDISQQEAPRPDRDFWLTGRRDVGPGHKEIPLRVFMVWHSACMPWCLAPADPPRQAEGCSVQVCVQRLCPRPQLQLLRTVVSSPGCTLESPVDPYQPGHSGCPLKQ